MPVFKIKLRRYVSRVVELDQTSVAWVDAPDVSTAVDAANKLCNDFGIDEYCGDWEDDNASRQATNDEVVEQPSVEWGDPVPSRHPKEWAADAREILNLDPETEED